VVTTLVNAILVTIESILGPILNAIALVIQFIFAIPILGRFLSWVWNIVTAVVYGVASVVDAIGWLIGIRPEKRLLLLVLNQLDEQRRPVAT
jgi:phage-related protein